MHRRTTFKALCFMFFSLSHTTQAASFTISNANIIDVNSGKIQKKQNILIQDDKIASIESAQQGQAQGDNVVDVKGQFVMPGFSDMHTHPYFTNDAKQFPTTDNSTFKEYLASGVTFIRDCGSNFDAVKSAQSRIAAKQLLGPRIASVGPMLDGKDTGFQTVEKIGSAQEANSVVSDLTSQGADYIKVHLKLTADAFGAIATACQQNNISFGGHVPDQINARTAVQKGMRIFEHMSRIESDNDVALLRGNEFTATCTLVQGPTPQRMKTCAGLQKGQTRVLSGTDSPAGQGLCPGRSLHRELELMNQAGLSPLEVLQSTTIRAAEAVNMENEIGTVEVGKFADLVILTKNPLEDIKNTRNVAGVVANGTYLSAQDIQKLRSAANVAKTLPFACGDSKAQKLAARTAVTCCSA
ncbi:hypothetical protein CDD83_3726 [Cordyceps sp. RAO-2017]|nr:hypothetical protein CDD83_3726 [Cordyceps sp. RAO-2017]